MKKKNLFFEVLLVFISTNFISMAQNSPIGEKYNMSSFKEKGTLLQETNFTGTVYLNIYDNVAKEYNTVLATVFFEPKARTNWHSHGTGQILIVTRGVGYYQEKGKRIKLIKDGDIVQIPKDIIHWHGASHDDAMDHVTMVPLADTGKTTWMGRVTDEQYDQGLNLLNSDDNKLTENALKNHEKLWPDTDPKIAQTDPELFELFNNWAFDEVPKIGNIDTKTRVIMIMGSCIAQGAITEYKTFVNTALELGVTPVEIREVLYQSTPYVGMAKVIDFIYCLNSIFAERNIVLPLERQSTTNKETRFDKGFALQKETFGERIDEMQKNAPKDQKHIQYFLSANCFGDYYTRTGLDMKTRELLTYSLLISMGNTESQVRGHIQGNINVGNNRETLIAITTQLLPFIGYPRTLNALNAINEITK